MSTRRYRRWLAAASVVTLSAVGIGGVLALRSGGASVRIATMGHSGLQVRHDADGGRRGSGPELRCFVEGRFVGAMAIEACAQKNGVSSQALDVGLADASNVTSNDSSPDPELAADAAAPPALAAVRPQDAPPPVRYAAECMRFGADGWRTVGSRMPLAACVRALYQGTCVDPGDALYGRSGELTLRLVAGRVESSDDDRRFRLVMTQNDDCTLDG